MTTKHKPAPSHPWRSYALNPAASKPGALPPGHARMGAVIVGGRGR
jgi:hypothetical protein